MKINKLKINSFGKLKDKEIELNDNINIIYGENESGKSTLLKFITNCFYGTSKNKKGKELSDYEKYKPWVGEEFSGKLEYELDNGEKFEIYREFNKKNPKIFNVNSEDISKQFNIDKNKGNEFFYEQTKIDEDLFLSTLNVGQKEIKLEKNEQNFLIQKIANLVGTGEDNVSYKKAIDRLNRKQLDEIGTERSKEKPINLIKEKINNLIEEKQNIKNYKIINEKIEEEEKNLINENLNDEKILEFFKQIKKIEEKEKIEKEKIQIKEEIKNKEDEKIKLLKKEIEEIENQEKNNKYNKDNKNNNKKTIKKINNIFIFIFIIIIIINIIQFIFIKNKLFNYIFLLTIPVNFIIYFIIKNKLKKQINKQQKNIEKTNEKINNKLNEIKLIEENKNNLEEEIKNEKNKINLNINLEKEKLKNQYLINNKINNNINDIINNKINDNINFEIEKIQNKINENKIELHKLKINKENAEQYLENLSKIEEEINIYNNQYNELEKLNKSINIAKEMLNISYEKMKNTVTPKFTNNLSNIISEITNNKYNKVVFNEEDGLMVELQNGNYMPIYRLSEGTIDQLYLSLRLSMAEELSQEKIPIFLDEAFAFYDEYRLENILKYINNKFKNRQIIIFTCTSREKEILEKLQIKYNLVSL